MAKPIPFIGPPGQRGVTTGDQRFINVVFEVEKNPSPSQYPVQILKRPGLANSTQPSGGAAVGRGLYAWGATGKIYSVFDNKIYSNTTDLAVTLAASSGRVWFWEQHVDTGTRQLIVSDGADNYNITTADGITQIDATDDGDYPVTNLGCIVGLDGYVFQAQSNGKIWNSDLNSAVAWTATSFLTADTHGADLEAIHRQKDQIIAFTKNRIEFYFNNGNPTGSPLLRIDQNTLGFGIAHKNSLAFSGETVCFVSQNPSDGDGARSVFMITSLGKVTEIASANLIRILNAEGTDIATCSAWMESVAGHLLYVLNLDACERTFVYDADEGLWCEWEAAAGGAKFNGVAATSMNGVTYVQDAANGRIYTMATGTYQDSGTTFSVKKQTSRSNFGSGHRKFESSLDLIADTTEGTVTVEVSDDDFTSFRTVGTIDMTRPMKRVTRLGAFYARSHRFTYTQNAAYRAQAFLPTIVEGSH